MPQPKLDRAAFDATLVRAGLSLSPPQLAELYAAWGTLETLCARLHAPLPPEAEPALIFVPDAT